MRLVDATDRLRCEARAVNKSFCAHAKCLHGQTLSQSNATGTSYSAKHNAHSGVLCRELSVFDACGPSRVVHSSTTAPRRRHTSLTRAKQKRNAISRGRFPMPSFRSPCRVRIPLGCALLCAALLAGGAPVDDKRIKAAADDNADWLSHGRTYDEQRFSPLS